MTALRPLASPAVRPPTFRRPQGLLLVAVLLCFSRPIPSYAQISPGPLSKAHGSVSGATQCAECHGLGRGAAQLKCLDCHAEIRERLAGGRGFHARVLPKGAGGKDCVACHSEHNGSDFNLIRWVPSLKAFDHNKMGWALEGKHAPLDCKQCHKPDRITPAERRTIAVKDLSRTYLGLTRSCLSCHVDEHRGQLSKDCQNCHGISTWKSTEGFDHAKTKYPLTGAHEKVVCQKCHVAVEGPKPYIKYTGISFQNCVSCHADPHHRAFANTCQSCHMTASWRQFRGIAKFDHSKTNFPLLGKHGTVFCEKCHRDPDFKKPIPHAKCMDCHQDPHRGQFRERKTVGECSECHDVKGFKPSLFTVAMHAAAKYPLEGQHEKVACSKCHIPKGADTVFKIISTACLACHVDVHKGQFAGSPHKNRCEDCHTVQSFHSAKFTLAQHNQTRFPLTGAHIAVQCDACHKPRGKEVSAAPVNYRFEDRSCTACHVDPHNGQFDERMKKARADGSLAGCEACHTTGSWHTISGFDHSTTSFLLLGAHRAVVCSGCHLPENLQTTLKNVDFKKAPARCEGCHEDAHASQFSKYGNPPRCDDCHNSMRWRPSTFDHEAGSAFSLKGAHQAVPCAQCHFLFRQVNGRKVLYYKPTLKECAGCHN
jgi:hypothetical protein